VVVPTFSSSPRQERKISEAKRRQTRDLVTAKARYAPQASWDPESVGYFMQCVLQGAFILAKTKQSAEIATASLGHLRNYLVGLLGHPDNEQGVPV
jgi:TetR/AcrR family transcriptional regulator, transcriptional repressor for nem operon